jgi:hypothetical protein
MSDETPRLKLPELADGQEMDAMTINDALIQLDAVTDICLKGQFVNTPPSSPADGDTYLLGAVPTGVWNGCAYKIAYCLDGGWRFYTPFNGLRAFVSTTNATLIYVNGTWLDGAALLNAAETSVASAAACNLGAAASLFVTVTGTTAITGLGIGANLLRFVRFAGALTLTHNATSLILLGGASRAVAAGDCGIYASDASGNWRERAFFAAGVPPLSQNLAATATPSFAKITAPNTAKAWAYYNPAGPTLLASHNISGITRNGTGDVTLTFTTPMSSASYAAVASADDTPAIGTFVAIGARGTTTLRLYTGLVGGAALDHATSVLVFGA